MKKNFLYAILAIGVSYLFVFATTAPNDPFNLKALQEVTNDSQVTSYPKPAAEPGRNNDQAGKTENIKSAVGYPTSR